MTDRQRQAETDSRETGAHTHTHSKETEIARQTDRKRTQQLIVTNKPKSPTY